MRSHIYKRPWAWAWARARAAECAQAQACACLCSGYLRRAQHAQSWRDRVRAHIVEGRADEVLARAHTSLWLKLLQQSELKGKDARRLLKCPLE